MNGNNKNLIFRGWVGYYKSDNDYFKYTACHNDSPPNLFTLKREVIADPLAHHGASPPLNAVPVVLITRDEYNRLKELDND